MGVVFCGERCACYIASISNGVLKHGHCVVADVGEGGVAATVVTEAGPGVKAVYFGNGVPPAALPMPIRRPDYDDHDDIGARFFLLL